VEGGGGLAGAVAEGQAVLVEGEGLLEVVAAELLGGLTSHKGTLSSFCFSTLIAIIFSKSKNPIG
jgi:hypothetical protein